MKSKRSSVIPLVIAVLAVLWGLYRFNFIPHRGYTDADFGIETYVSGTDMDGDGIDDQRDVLENVRAYIATEPVYKSAYYKGGYPDDGYGTCVDIVNFGLKGAGYDMMELVAEDVELRREAYASDVGDKNIDFRRVRNLKVYFEENAIVLTDDLRKIEEWQGGDIVLTKNHVGIVSDKRNRRGVPFVIHHYSPYQKSYEEDDLGSWEILGHYRMS